MTKNWQGPHIEEPETKTYTLSNLNWDLRDHIAIAALQGMLAHSTPDCGNSFTAYPDETAEHAYTLADAMLRARKKEG